jgi:dihydrolipoamide dehydrogenase
VSNSYDVVVIGAGTGGYVAAIRAAQLGKRVAVVERQRALGGTCLLWGCIPTKALLEHAHALDVVRRASDWGITMPAGHAPGIDMARVLARQTSIVGGLSKGIEFLFRKNQIDWVKGSARLLGNGRMHVSGSEERTLTAGHVVIATGSAPRAAEGIAFDGTRVISSDEAITLAAVPRSMAILGGGAVGVEFASIFRRFGSAVTLIELEPRLVPTEDEAVSAQLEKSFVRQGIRVLTRTRLVAATPAPQGLGLEALGPDGTVAMDADVLLVAIGRRPVTDGLGIEELGAQVDRGFIRVDSLYRTSIPDVSAIGDVISLGAVPHPQLAHVSSMEGVLVAERVAGLAIQPLEYDHVPHCTYCDPEIGSVGLTETEARRRGHDVRIGTFPFGVLGRAKMAGEAEGFVKIVADTKYDEVLGVHLIGPRSTELVAEAVMALRLESTVEELVRTVHAHPTFSEAVGEAAHAAHGAAIHL